MKMYLIASIDVFFCFFFNYMYTVLFFMQQIDILKVLYN